MTTEHCGRGFESSGNQRIAAMRLRAITNHRQSWTALAMTRCRSGRDQAYKFQCGARNHFSNIQGCFVLRHIRADFARHAVYILPYKNTVHSMVL